MEFVLGIKRKGIIIFHLDIRKDRRDVAFVRYLLDGRIMPIAHVVTIN